MPELDDEDALRWAGEDTAAPSLRRSRPQRSSVRHVHDVESTTETDVVLDLDDDDEAAVTSSAALVTFGVLGGVYFLTTLGWLTFALRSFTHGGDPLAALMFNLGLWFAVAAPALWFSVSFWLIDRLSVRYAALIVGAVVLLPIPLVWPS